MDASWRKTTNPAEASTRIREFELWFCAPIPEHGNRFLETAIALACISRPGPSCTDSLRLPLLETAEAPGPARGSFPDLRLGVGMRRSQTRPLSCSYHRVSTLPISSPTASAGSRRFFLHVGRDLNPCSTLRVVLDKSLVCLEPLIPRVQIGCQSPHFTWLRRGKTWSVAGVLHPAGPSFFFLSEARKFSQSRDGQRNSESPLGREQTKNGQNDFLSSLLKDWKRRPRTVLGKPNFRGGNPLLSV